MNTYTFFDIQINTRLCESGAWLAVLHNDIDKWEAGDTEAEAIGLLFMQLALVGVMSVEEYSAIMALGNKAA